ncbi:MAG: hypothetical protein FJ404_05775 [Verrucomicrobia bacterium]|nr:hypothetical protein [Verrucomicrobiota bacterium]
MANGPKKLIVIRAGVCDYAEVELRGTLQIVGPNNTGKTTLINTLQFLYLDDRRHMDFGTYTPEQTRDYYFPGPFSYVLFECQGTRGDLVLGWRGQSRAAGGEPERFMYEGPYDSLDFLTEQGEVREAKAVNARLALKQYTVLRSAQEHRELLLQSTKGESKGEGLVVLRDNDKYPQFRETLKNLLCLSAISQDQMKGRLLMLAGLPTERCALDVRELFGDDYERILRNKQKLTLFKKHEPEVKRLLQAQAARDLARGEMAFAWADLREKRVAFEAEHQAQREALRLRFAECEERLRVWQAEAQDRMAEVRQFSEARGAAQARLGQVEEQGREFGEFVEELARASLKNAESDVRRLEHQLGEAEREQRDQAEKKVRFYQDLTEERRRRLSHEGRALMGELRRDFSEPELRVLAGLFNLDLFSLPVGDDGVRILDRELWKNTLRKLAARVEGGWYRDGMVTLPIPESAHALALIADPASMREQLKEGESILARWRGILHAIVERESMEGSLRARRNEAESLQKQLLRFEQWQLARGELPRFRAELAKVDQALASATGRLSRLEDELREERSRVQRIERTKIESESRFNEAMGKFNQCVFPETSARTVAPTDPIPDRFEEAAEVYLRRQGSLGLMEREVESGLRQIEAKLGSDFSGAEESETLKTLREELEALPEREQALGRDWEHQLHQLRATFDEVLRSLGDIKSAADRLNRSFAAVQVSNLKSLRMEVVEHAEIVGAMRRLSQVDQPGLFEESAALESAVSGFRRKFESNPLLRYDDLFALSFTVTGGDGKTHRYSDFRQVESHGTTITIKVLFNLVVLRSLLREDSHKNLHCEVPFFLDEVHSLDGTNRHAILTMARKLGFIAITAAPDSVSEVDALYFLQPRQGRFVLRHAHRIGVKTR